MAERVEIAVIGAGIIGLAIAHRLAGAGREVLVIDPEPPGSGASFGNAGVIADYAVEPVGTPDVLWSLPRLLFSRQSPLAIRHAEALTLAPWLMRFVRQSLPGAARRNGQVLAGLVADAGDRWRELAEAVGGGDLLRAAGCVYWYRSDAAWRDAAGTLALRRGLGVVAEPLSATALQALEPGLPVRGGGGIHFPQVLSLSDPGVMVGHLARATWARGAALRTARVTGLEAAAQGVRLTGPGLDLTARHAIIAAGARSAPLARMAGDPVPLDTERGYHLEWDGAEAPVTRPVCPIDLGFYFCPMRGRLRVAGTVELGGINARPSPHRLRRIEAGVGQVFPSLGPPDRSWMGLRPSVPDSLPVIGRARGVAGVIHAFGHGHLGMTLAPLTAELVEACLAGRDDPRLTPLHPARF